MAEAILLAVSKIGAVIVNDAVRAVVDKLSRKADNLQNLPGKVKRIEDELRVINDVIKGQGTTQLSNDNDAVKTWISCVRKLAYRVEDAIDKYSYEALKLKEQGFLSKFIITGNHHYKVFTQIAKEVEEIEKDIKQIREMQSYWVNTVQQPTRNEHAGSDRKRHRGCFPELIHDDDLVGIEENRSKLTRWLSTDDKENTLITVSGMGGLGKTTLVRNVYDRENANFPDAHAWIVVSQAYDVADLLGTLLSKISHTQQLSPLLVNTGARADVGALREAIKKILQHKKCLIVLDDVWDKEAYTMMKSTFQGLQGSRVVITTRKDEVAVLAPEGRRLQLQPLETKESFKLFCIRAFHNNPDHKCPPELEEVAKSVVNSCHGLPIAIVSAGSLLCTKQQTHHAWNQIYNHLCSDLREDHHVQAILTLSYHDLSGDLRNCFLYCSMFPEDYHISGESLVRLWVAEGFVVKKDKSTPEEVAEDILMELIGRNMLEVVERDELNRVRTCKMHDIVRDLALAVAKEERFGSASDQGKMKNMD